MRILLFISVLLLICCSPKIQRSIQTYQVKKGEFHINVVEIGEVQATKSINISSPAMSWRFGALKIEHDNKVSNFQEKPDGDGSWINGGFFVLEPQVFNYLENDSTIFERKPLQSLAHENQLKAFHHHGFWMPMDKLSDKVDLEKMWNENKAPWKVW